MKTPLTPSQHAILAHAIEHSQGSIVWFPAGINGGARKKVLLALSSRSFISLVGESWRVTDAGFSVLGALPLAVPVLIGGSELDEGDKSAVELPIELTETVSEPVQGRNSKQAHVITLLKRAEGATIAQICEVTQWQAHTVRGLFAGTFKKKLGLDVRSIKDSGGKRVYRLD